VLCYLALGQKTVSVKGNESASLFLQALLKALVAHQIVWFLNVLAKDN